METERLLIDAIRESDKADYFENISHDRRVLETFVCRYAERMEDLDFSPYPESRTMFAIRLKQTRRLIGLILYFDDTGERCEIGYGIGSAHWGRGYATEAVRRFLDWLMEEKGFRTVTASYFTGNDASRRVMEKCGMYYDHFSEREFEYLGAERDLTYYALSKDRPAALETERLLLRPWEETDAAECFRYSRDPRVGPAAGWPVHTDEAESRKIIREILAVPETYAVVWKETMLPIGSVGLHFHTDIAKAEGEAELGYWVGVPYWGRGVAPEAARRLLRHAFADLRLKAVWCCYFVGNEKSMRVQEKLGFRYQRTNEAAQVAQLGETRREHINLLTREDWLKTEE